MEEAVRVEERTKRCPSCGGLNAADADWCGQCLQRFSAPSPPPPPPPPPVQAGPRAADPPAPTAAPPAPERKMKDLPVGVERGAFKVTEEGVTWTCSRCDSTNPMEVTVCPVCGSDLATTLRPPGPERPRRDPNMTALISLLLPGAGHAYLGQWAQGVARGIVQMWILATALIGAVQGTPLVWVTFGIASVALWVVAAHDAYREAADEGRGVFLRGRVFLWVVLGLLALLLFVVLGTAVRAPSSL